MEENTNPVVETEATPQATDDSNATEVETQTEEQANVPEQEVTDETEQPNSDDNELMEQENAPQVVFFSHKTATKGGLWTEGDRILMDVDGEAYCMAEISKMKIFGPHNEENAMAAIACAAKAGVPAEIIREQLYAFKGVAHRIEDVGCVNSVNYYNDSKATNPDAAIKAVQAMNRPTIVIGGGYDKDSQYDEWIESFGDKVRWLILLGQTREKIEQCAKKHGFTNVILVDSLEEAVAP